MPAPKIVSRPPEMVPIDPKLCGKDGPAAFQKHDQPFLACQNEINNFISFLETRLSSTPQKQCHQFEPQAPQVCKPNPEILYIRTLLGTDSGGDKNKLFFIRATSADDKERYSLLGEVIGFLPDRAAIRFVRCAAEKDPNIFIQDQAAVNILHWGVGTVNSRGFLFCRGIIAEDQTSFQRGLSRAREIIDTIGRDDVPVYEARLLAMIGTKEDISRLEILLKSKNDFTVVEAAAALIAIGDVKSSREALARLALSAPYDDSGQLNYYSKRAAFSLGVLDSPNTNPYEIWNAVEADFRKKKEQLIGQRPRVVR